MSLLNINNMNTSQNTYLKSSDFSIENKNYLEELNDDQIQRLNGDKLIEAGIRALNKQPTVRSKQDIDILMRLTEEVQFFKNHFGSNHYTLLQEYSEYFGYQKFEQGQTVFKQGDIGDKFYLILRGQVKVIIQVKRQQITEDKGKKIKVEYEEQMDIKVLYSGDTFGELALIDQKPRGATILCLEDCDLITFEKHSFFKILKDQQTEKLRNEIKQLNKVYLFKDFSLNLLKNIYLLFSITSYQRGDVLFKEGDHSDKLYIIREGEFKISKRFEYNQDGLKLNKLNNNERRNKVLNLDIGIIGKFQPLGEEEFFMGGYREVTATCVSKDALVMSINKKDLLKKMSYDQNSVKLMFNRAKEKQEFREEKLQSMKEKHQEDEETILLKNYKQNIYKLSQSKEDTLEGESLKQFIELTPSNQNISMSLKQKRNFIVPDSNTIRSKANTYDQQGLSQSSGFAGDQQESPTPKRTGFGNILSSKKEQSFGVSTPRQIFSQFSQEPDSVKNKGNFMSESNTLNMNPNMRNKEFSITKAATPKQSFTNKNSDNCVSNSYNFTSYFNNISNDNEDIENGNNSNNSPKSLGKQMPSFQLKNSLFSQTQQDTNEKQKKSIKLKIKSKILENEKQDSEIKNKTQDSHRQNSQGSRKNINNEDNKSQSKINVQTHSKSSRSNITNTDSDSDEKEEFVEEELAKSPTEIKNQNNKMNLQRQPSIKSAQNYQNQGGPYFTLKDSEFSLSLPVSQKVFNTDSKIEGFSPAKPDVRQLYFSSFTHKTLENEKDNSFENKKKSSFHNSQQQLSESNLIEIQSPLSYGQTGTNGKIPSKNKKIGSSERPRHSIMVDKSKDFFSLDNKAIQEKAKAKSIQKNPFLYIDEFPLPKNVSTNLDDNEVDRLIQEKLISSVIKGNSSKQINTLISPKQGPVQRMSFFNPENLENKIGVESEKQNVKQKLNKSLNTNEDSFYAFFHQSQPQPQKNDKTIGATTTQEDIIIKQSEQQQLKQQELQKRYSNQDVQFHSQKQQKAQSLRQITRQTSNNNDGGVTPLPIRTRTMKKSSGNIVTQNAAYKMQRPQSSIQTTESKYSIKKQVNLTESSSNCQRKLIRPNTSYSHQIHQKNEYYNSAKDQTPNNGLKFILFDDLPSSPQTMRLRQASAGNSLLYDKQYPERKELTTEFIQKVENLINKNSEQMNKQQIDKGNQSKIPHHTRKSSSTVFKHSFKQSPCQLVNNQAYHFYNCKEKNDGKCQCQSNHLNFLPLKFSTEMILHNQKAIKRNNFPVRLQGKFFLNVQ